ncbi:hypothetical protein J2847_002939 [Azospirillum agricola]|uniref:hypothetical protein n=1 Tax=Azospirillum agricola TaxID=1720247 RepID=UPI001AE7A233|nr:hypothetical protein [Azospirillum agricola]MBP2229640.1 hypothetical protein [Azospirillum agricola]
MSPELLPWLAGGAGFFVGMLVIAAIRAPSAAAVERQRTAWKLIDAMDDLADEMKALRAEIQKNGGGK